MRNTSPLLLPPEVLFSISLPVWRALFRAFDPTVRAASHAAIDRHLQTAASTPLAHALVTIEALSTPAGRVALGRAAVALNVPSTSIPRASGDAELAAHVVLLAADAEEGSPLASLVECAQTELFRSDPWHSAPREHRLGDGIDVSVVPGGAAMAERLRDALDDEAVHSVIPLVRRGEATLFQVRSLAPAPAVAMVMRDVNNEKSKERILSCATPSSMLVSDLLEWVPDRRVLRIHTRDAERVPVLRDAFGRAVADDATLFTAAPTCTLSPLKEKGALALSADAMAFEVKEVRLTALRWDSGDCDVVTLEGRDVLAGLTARGWSLAGGQPLGAQLRVVLPSGKRLSVVIEPPNRVHIPPGKHAALLWRLLDTLGLTWVDRPAERAAKRQTLWGADPFIATREAWKRLLGDDYAPLAALVAPPAIVSHQVRALPHGDHPDHGRVIVAMPRRDGEDAYGASFDPDVPSRLVPVAELSAERLDVGALATHLARGLGLDGASNGGVARELEGRGCYALGRRTFGSTTAEVTFLPRDPGAQGAALFAFLALRAVDAIPVLLVPPGCRARSDLRQVEMGRIGAGFEEVLAGVVRAVGATGRFRRS